MKKVAYLAMDVHAGHCVLGHMDFDGTFIGNRRFPTSEQHIIEALKAIKAKEKYLASVSGLFIRLAGLACLQSTI